MTHDPIHRQYHHGELTFRMIYAFNENFMLPLSHDEVVHARARCWPRCRATTAEVRQSAAALRLHVRNARKETVVHGGEFGQADEWHHDGSLQWHLTEHPRHNALPAVGRRLNHAYREEPALHELDCDGRGFEWIDAKTRSRVSSASFGRSQDNHDLVAVAGNFTPVARLEYRIGVPGRAFGANSEQRR